MCHFMLSLVLEYLWVQKYPDAGKSMRGVAVTPFVCAPNASKKLGLESSVPYASRQSTGNRQIDPILPMCTGGLGDWS